MKQKTIELVNFLHQLVIKKKLLKSNQSLILAISGGQDSISLLFIFIQLKDQWNWKLSIIYCNHLWQKDSFYTMLHLFKLSYLLNQDLYLAVTLQKVLTEQKARNWRSLTFQRITGFYLFSVIVTGHSKSDRIETGFFNLLRGSGTQGVGSLNWTKVKTKDYFFKLNKNNYKQISIKSETKKKFLVMGLRSSVGSALVLRKRTTSMQEGATSMRLLPAHRKQKKGLLKSCSAFSLKVPIKTRVLPTLAYSNQTKKGYYQEKEIKKQTKRYTHQEEMSTQKKRRTLPMPDASANKSVVFVRQRYSLTKRRTETFENKNKKDSTLLKPSVLTSQKAHTASAFLVVKIRAFIGTFEDFNETKIENFNKPFFCFPCIPLFDVRSKKALLPSYGANCIARGPLETLFLSQFYKNEYILVRPFLSLTRFDLKKICNSWKTPLFPDQSNQKLKYQRNRIRKQILPTLRFFFNPQIDTTIYQFIEILNSEQEYMDFITARIVNEIQFDQKQTIVELETSFINVLPLPIRRKVIKQFLKKFAHKKNYKFFDVEQFLQQISRACFLKEQKINEKNMKFFETKYLHKSFQKDFLVNIINQKKGKCKLYKLFFFPKTGSIFLQSQRFFFYKKT